MIQEVIHSKICENLDVLQKWYQQKVGEHRFPFYASFDIRDSGCKVVPVDANLFPAGFNNICSIDQENSLDHMQTYLTSHYPGIRNIALLTEEHTNNRYYWQNVYALLQALENADYNTKVVMAQGIENVMEVETVNGQTVKVHSLDEDDNKYFVDGIEVDLVISNNDFSVQYDRFSDKRKTPMTPPYKMGWHNRKKQSFFEYYNKLAREFAQLIDIDPWFLTVETNTFSDFNVGDEENRLLLAEQVDKMIKELKVNAKTDAAKENPFVVVKNSSGTYGLGILMVNSGEDVLNWNYKSKKKMKATKGGGGVSDLIIQEGVSTKYVDKDETAEPVIYTLGSRLVGGFLRAHSKKGPEENLNSPGAVYKRLCVSDLEFKRCDCPMENVYGWVSKIGVLALAYEAESQNESF